MRLRDAALRVRAWLDGNLFPDAPPPRQLTWRRGLVGAGVAIGLTAVQLARMWSSKPLDSMWAEDGYRWLTDGTQRGFIDNLGTAYDGYLQTSSRIVGEFVAFLPASWFAWAMALAGAAIVTACAFVVWSATAGHIASPHLRAALSGMVVLLPVVGVEVLDNVTNAIWFVLFAGFWILLWRPPTLARASAAAAGLLLVTLSTIGAVFLVPLWLLRVLAIRDSRDAVVVATFPIGVTIQLATLSDPNPLTSPHWDWGLFPAYAQRVIDGAVAGDTIAGALWEAIGTPVEIVSGAALVAFVGAAILRGDPLIRVFVPLAVATSLGAFLVSGYERNVTFALLWPHGSSGSGGARYVVVPTLLLLSALFVWLDRGSGLTRAPPWLSPRTGVAGFVVVAALVSFEVGDRASRGSLTWSAPLAQARAVCATTQAPIVRVPVSPPVFGLAAELPCAKVQ